MEVLLGWVPHLVGNGRGISKYLMNVATLDVRDPIDAYRATPVQSFYLPPTGIPTIAVPPGEHRGARGYERLPLLSVGGMLLAVLVLIKKIAKRWRTRASREYGKIEVRFQQRFAA